MTFSRAQARAAGMTDRQIDRRLRTGEWTPLRRSWFRLRTGSIDESAPVDPAVLAAIRSTGRPAVLSHAHAARAWGLPRPLAGWGDPVLTAADGPTRNRTGLRIAVASLDDADVVRPSPGLSVTSLARTVADCARTLPGHDALAIADAAAARFGGVAPLQRAVDRCAGWPGARRARRVIALADPCRETPLESWSAWCFEAHGLERARWQVDLTDGVGAFLGRVDAWWTAGVVGESDGRTKYRLAAAERGGLDGERLAQVLDAEREREMALRRAGARVVRWGPRDVLDPTRATALADHLRRELSAATHSPTFTGRAITPRCSR